MKNFEIDISAIEEAIENAGSSFTISQLQKKLGNKSAAFTGRLRRILDGDDRFFSDGDNFCTRDSVFEGKEFLITPDSWEICEKILVPGHRFSPFLEREFFPSDAELVFNGKTLPKREITAPFGKIFHYHTLLGADTVADHLVAESPNNTGLIYNATQTSQVTLTVFDLAGVIDDFSDGDALAVKVKDFYDGVLEVRTLKAESRHDSARRSWITAMDKAMKRVIEQFEEYLDIPDQLSWALYYGKDELFNSACSLDEYITFSRNIYISTDGDHAVLASSAMVSTSDEESDAEGDGSDVFSLSKGALDPQKMLRELGSILSQVEIDAFILDCCYARETDFDDFFRRLFGEVTPEYADDAQRAALLNYLEEKFENQFENYNRSDDEPKAELRSMILEAVSARMEFMLQLSTLDKVPESSAMQEIAGIAHHLEHILEALNSPRYTPHEDELRQLSERAEELIEEQEKQISQLLKQ